MTLGITKSKPTEWEARDLHDGRIGLFRNGLVVRVFYSMEELKQWCSAKNDSIPLPKDLALRAAIGRL